MKPSPYDSLHKLSWSPSGARVSQVWGWLFPLVIASFGYTIFRTLDGWFAPVVRVPFILNFILLVIFARLLLQQGHPGRLLALALAIDATLVVAIAMVAGTSPAVTLVQLPYVIWMGVLTLTQIAIVRTNGKQAPNRI